MENTYTFTARSATDTAKMVTFTLHDHRMSVELGAPLEHVERALQVPEEEGEMETEQENRLQPWAKPVAVSLLERGLRPFHIADVDASAEEGGLQMRAWVRTAGLRLAPITLRIEEVDNPEATEAFVQQVEERKESADDSGRLPGPMDYWAGWFLAGLAGAALLIWQRKSTGASK